MISYKCEFGDTTLDYTADMALPVGWVSVNIMVAPPITAAPDLANNLGMLPPVVAPPALVRTGHVCPKHTQQDIAALVQFRP